MLIFGQLQPSPADVSNKPSNISASSEKFPYGFRAISVYLMEDDHLQPCQLLTSNLEHNINQKKQKNEKQHDIFN